MKGPPYTVFLVLAFAACDRPVPKQAVVETSEPRDTIRTMVVRVERRASAIQRVTGAIEARRALQPLDSLLAVRVLDQRGGEFAGAEVRWTMEQSGDGASLVTVNSITDSGGVARARFTPGRSGAPQHAVAELESVGRIAFTVMIPAAGVRVRPDNLTIWSDEHARVEVVLFDDRGTELQGGAAQWAVRDTSVASVVTARAESTTVSGRLAGITDVVAFVGEVRGSARVTVRPVLGGAFVTIDGAPVPHLTMEVRSGALREAVAVQNGRFGRRVALPFGGSVDVHASESTEPRRYHDVHVRVRNPRELQDLRIAMVPLRWRVAGGSYAGREVPIDAERAMRRTAGSPFWRLVPLSGSGPRRLLGWPASAFPLRIAFDRVRSAARVTAADSIAFWAIAAQMERDIGRQLFEPAEISTDRSLTSTIPVEIDGQSSEGHTFVSWGQAGDVHDGVLRFRATGTLRAPHVVTHELLHLLGFGHTSAWHTVAVPAGGREPRLTPEDVAYVQLAMRLREIQQETGALPGLPIAAQ